MCICLLIFLNSPILFYLHKYSSSVRGKSKRSTIHSRITFAFYCMILISVFGVILPALQSISKRNALVW